MEGVLTEVLILIKHKADSLLSFEKIVVICFDEIYISRKVLRLIEKLSKQLALIKRVRLALLVAYLLSENKLYVIVTIKHSICQSLMKLSQNYTMRIILWS